MSLKVWLSFSVSEIWCHLRMLLMTTMEMSLAILFSASCLGTYVLEMDQFPQCLFIIVLYMYCTSPSCSMHDPSPLELTSTVNTRSFFWPLHLSTGASRNCHSDSCPNAKQSLFRVILFSRALMLDKFVIRMP